MMSPNPRKDSPASNCEEGEANNDDDDDVDVDDIVLPAVVVNIFTLLFR
jgi:hypothetical protein